MTGDDRKATDELLVMYQEYKDVDKQKESVAARLAKAKLLGEPAQALSQEYEELQARLQQISESMTYSSPVVWMTYKYEAYKDEAQPIRTMQDFRVHCSKPGYICTKRFDFLNAQLEKNRFPKLSDTTQYPDDLSLAEAIKSPSIAVLVQDQSFQKQWVKHEYYKDNGRVAKWENYLGTES